MSHRSHSATALLLRLPGAPCHVPASHRCDEALTLDEFLAWEDRQELKHEFDERGPVAMSGGTVAHATIQSNLALALGSRLRGQPCRFYGSDLKVEVIGRICYPDGMVSCTTQA